MTQNLVPELALARKNTSPVSDVHPGALPTDLEIACALQDDFIATLGSQVKGWKVAGSGKNTPHRKIIGEPVHGPLLADRFFEAPLDIALDQFIAPKLEPEVALRLAQSIAPGDALPPLDELFDGVFLGCDLADNRFADPESVGFLAGIADLGSFGAYILGPQIADNAVSFDGLTRIELFVNGVIASPRFGPENLHDPVEIAIWLIERLQQRGRGLSAGDLISTGTLAPPVMATQPCSVSVKYGDAAALTFRLV